MKFPKKLVNYEILHSNWLNPLNKCYNFDYIISAKLYTNEVETMPSPGDYTDFFQGLLSGTGVLLGFTLASQITILTHVLDLKESVLFSTPNKNKILMIFTWFFSSVTLVLCYCLVIFHAASTDTPDVYVRDELSTYVSIAYWAYILLPFFIMTSQVICSYVITKTLCSRSKE